MDGGDEAAPQTGLSEEILAFRTTGDDEEDMRQVVVAYRLEEPAFQPGAGVVRSMLEGIHEQDDAAVLVG